MSEHQPLILVVDDNPTNIKVLFELLEKENYRVLIAQNGESALQKLKFVTPNLILLDIMMSGMDGLEVCRRLKTLEVAKEIPVIFMTALSDAGHKVQGLSLGAIDYITKPIAHEEALARIRIHLKIQSLTQELAHKNDLLEQSNHQLEEKVKERTSKLNQALEELQSSHLQLVKQEKMSSLGQLVAGVAHEINNPMNFIYGNLEHADEYVQDLIGALELYQQHCPSQNPDLQNYVEEVDLEFIVNDLPKLIHSMSIGAERIRNMVLALRNFSRMDEAACKKVDIHEGLDSTLMILQHRLKQTVERPAIHVRKDYGELPLVTCYAGQLNQVFMNLLSNAVDALEEAQAGKSFATIEEEGYHITIHTSVLDKRWVQVAIADNGSGIPPTVQEQIFDPFFTTKPIGKGTGIGLSISRQIIVEQHRGQLNCLSSSAEGTEFIIQIPIDQLA
ncbi:MAG: hybrid sensor histidine kinase/response regulator [Merismopedia sp. SIO2A8]|nr:hybrid sensor histidine kinase/response regulator [Merismopedia sp. SIO2A8]